MNCEISRYMLFYRFLHGFHSLAHLWYVHAFRQRITFIIPHAKYICCSCMLFPCCVLWMYDLQVIRDKRTGKTKGLLEQKVEWTRHFIVFTSFGGLRFPRFWRIQPDSFSEWFLWYDNYPSLNCLERSHEDKLVHSLTQEDSSWDLKLLDEEGYITIASSLIFSVSHGWHPFFLGKGFTPKNGWASTPNGM